MYRTPPPALAQWIAELAPELGLDPEAVPAQELLDLTREVAHNVMRPAGPISTYLLGAAVAGGAEPDAAAATVRRHVEAWVASHPPTTDATSGADAPGPVPGSNDGRGAAMNGEGLA